MDNRGSTLIENVISIFLLTLFAAMACSGIVAGMTALTNASLENQRLYHIYSQIESNQYGSEVVSAESTFTFGFQDDTDSPANYTIDGKLHYDNEKNILGEFVRTP